MHPAVVISDAVSPDLIVASTDLVGNALLTAGCTEVTLATSVDEALHVISYLQPAVVVLDLLEPQGFEDYRKLLGRMHGRPLLAIVPEADMQIAFDAGVDDCIARPVRPKELVARARAAIRLRIERAKRSKRERKMSDGLRALQREKHDLERIVCVDSLTGIANRRHALALLDAEWKRSARESQPIALVMIDVDGFHAFNESYGHPGGDACLRLVTGEMVLCLRRPSDVLGRYGGEEFIAVLANTDAAGARIVAERLRAAVEALQIPHEASPCAKVVTVSIGFACGRPTPDTVPDGLVEAADTALLRAKSRGRNCTAGDAPEVEALPPDRAFRRFPVVVADPWYASRIPRFLDAIRGDIAGARSDCEVGGFDRIKTRARRLRGSASNHGIVALAKLANMLERAARADDQASIRGVVDEIEQYVDHVQVSYRRTLDRTQAG